MLGLAAAGYWGTQLLLSPENLSAWLAAFSICF
jgi:hypothetical protein